MLGADGWLRTGDIASIDADGFVTITDRKKDILVTAGGKNIAPQNLENDLKTSRFVSQAIVVGDRKPFPAALITLDPVEIEKWASEHGIEGDPASRADDARVRELVAGIVEEVNRDRSRYEQIKRFAILPRDFEMDRGEVTPTLKLRRRVVLDHFADEVAALYDGTGAPPPDTEVDPASGSQQRNAARLRPHESRAHPCGRRPCPAGRRGSQRGKDAAPAESCAADTTTERAWRRSTSMRTRSRRGSRSSRRRRCAGRG